MTTSEFNITYADFLEKGHYGLDLYDQRMIDYLDKEFEELIKLPNFSYSQIKKKFNSFRFYCNGVPSNKIQEIEEELYRLDNEPLPLEGYRKTDVNLGGDDMRQLVYNAVECLSCGAVVESVHGHDYQTCKCGNETICDGGLNYLRYGGIDMSKVKVIAHYFDEPHEVIRKFAFRSGYGKDGLGEFQITRIANMSDDYLNKAQEYLKDRIPKDKWKNTWFLQMLVNESIYRKNNNISIPE